jgi:Protein of unknown function (DUF3048) N-terminal domain/Protein of unknown function (DUF3048) C-terminal domain
MTRGTIWGRCVLAVSSCGVLVAVAGCAASKGSAPVTTSSGSPSGSPSASTATSAPANAGPSTGSVAPLTGLAAPAAIAQRPAVAVTVAGSNPVGLNSADVVYAEMASPARYIAVYQSNEANQAGPVTSTRPTDGPLLSVVHPLTGYNGGTSAFISVLDATKIIDDGYSGHASFYTGGSGGLTVSTAAIVASDKSDGPPPGLFSYRKPGTSLASARETHPTAVRIDVPGQPSQQWSFDAKADRWVETAGGPRVSVANLVVQIVSFKTVYLSRKYNQTAQSARVTGTGQVTVFSGTGPGESGGTAASGVWSKPGIAAVTNFFDTANQPMSFLPGPTWIVLAPAGTQANQAGG